MENELLAQHNAPKLSHIWRAPEQHKCKPAVQCAPCDRLRVGTSAGALDTRPGMNGRVSSRCLLVCLVGFCIKNALWRVGGVPMGVVRLRTKRRKRRGEAVWSLRMTARPQVKGANAVGRESGRIWPGPFWSWAGLAPLSCVVLVLDWRRGGCQNVSTSGR